MKPAEIIKVGLAATTVFEQVCCVDSVCEDVKALKNDIFRF
jgi:hypothetical protein